MKRFAALYTALDATTSTHDKLEALTSYFSVAEPEDAAWASYFLAGGKPRQSVPTRLLTEFARERAGLPSRIFCRPRNAAPNSASHNGSSSAC
jgi:DNA ligase-1